MELDLKGKDMPKVLTYELHPKEHHGAILVVKDDEVPVQKYVNPTELAARERRQKEEDERRRVSQKRRLLLRTKKRFFPVFISVL